MYPTTRERRDRPFKVVAFLPTDNKFDEVLRILSGRTGEATTHSRYQTRSDAQQVIDYLNLIVHSKGYRTRYRIEEGE